LRGSDQTEEEDVFFRHAVIEHHTDRHDSLTKKEATGKAKIDTSAR
jgi:hypothetical protein